MRYSFHGKVRATGQQVDGFVEASSSSEAIDRLADQGIIGVYTVRPEAKRPKNAVILSGQDWVEDDESVAPSTPVPAVSATPTPRVALPSVNGTSTGNPAVLQHLVDQIQLLVAQVEKLSSRPSQVIYQSGPIREGGSKKKSNRIFNDDQNSTLRDIFQNNLDLRRSLEKLANTAARPSDGPPRDMPAIRENAPREIPKPPREHLTKARDHQMQAQPAA